MAQYDLVLFQNNATSGLAFTEVNLGKPPDVGYALTQNPVNGLLAWKPAFLLMATLPDQSNINEITTTGYYDLPTGQGYSNSPSSSYPAILQVYDIKSMIVQIYYASNTDGSGSIMWHRRKLGSSWSPWTSFGASNTPPAELLSEQDVIDLINARNTQIIAENPVIDIYDLIPRLKNTLILLYAELDTRNRTDVFTINIPHQNHLGTDPFEIGSTYDICLMTNIPAYLNFLPDETIIQGGEQTIHTSTDLNLVQYRPVRLICINHNTWLIQSPGTSPHR
ncbi:MAG: pyocin knob domain-containing protein [Bacteroidia bacterium]|nr:pyocin knob domain-containing protein [Bacteroidia bacterium]